MGEQTTSNSIKLKRPLGWLAIGFGIFHCTTLGLAMLPRSWGVNQALAPYRQLTGTEQEWGMFHSIPTLQQNEITVEVVDGSFGPILPGLRDYKTHDQIRHYYLFNRLTDPDSVYFDAYVEGLRKALVEQGVDSSAEFSLRIESDFIRLLERIDEDGKMTLRKSEVRGPFSMTRP